jgi:formate dehydrogenase subunit gamma
MRKRDVIQRYNDAERINHWIVAITFILLALSGLALFHPAFFFLTNLFGGGTWARILHPFIGLVMFVAFLVLALRVWRANLLDKNDEQWLKQIPDVVANREEKLPEVGKYNAGQKLLFWVQVVCLILLLLTGIVIWQPYFAPAFNIIVIRIAVVLHAFSAFILILGIIIHIYAGIWVKGSIRAMTRGWVTRAWARKHHPAWYREVASGEGMRER